jgi:hypothetical protein
VYQQGGDAGMDNMHDPREDREPYGFMERELAFKLLAAHALVDAEFYDWLRRDPENAAAQLHIRLTDKDIDYIQNVVEWDSIDGLAPDIRERLHLDLVTNSW